jgi:hypothetical protein
VFPQEIAKQAIEKAKIGMYGGVTMYKNQSQALHTVGINTGSPLVDGADQETTYALATATSNGWSQTLVTNGWTASQTGILKAGDVFTMDGVYSVNRRTRASTGQLQTFTVLAAANSGGGAGAATLTISPPMIIAGSYKTVTAAPDNDAVITVLTGTGGSSYRQNLMFHPNAITVGMAPLDVPVDGATSSVQSYDGISIAATRQFDIDSYLTKYRFDILFGVKYQNPDFAVRVTS